MPRAVIAVDSDADRVLAAALTDLGPVLAELRGSVLVLGGLMQRIWLELRPVEGTAARATADVDLGIDRKSLRLTATSERVGPLLKQTGYRPLPGEDGFRFEKKLERGSMLVDLFVAKGASRNEPPLLERGIETLAAPGLAYALTRPAVMVELELVDGSGSTVVDLPLPSLDAAFVLKAALVESGVRLRPDRRERDTRRCRHARCRLRFGLRGCWCSPPNADAARSGAPSPSCVRSSTGPTVRPRVALSATYSASGASHRSSRASGWCRSRPGLDAWSTRLIGSDSKSLGERFGTQHPVVGPAHRNGARLSRANASQAQHEFVALDPELRRHMVVLPDAELARLGSGADRLKRVAQARSRRGGAGGRRHRRRRLLELTYTKLTYKHGSLLMEHPRRVPQQGR